MELIELRIIGTVLSFVVFLGILVWAYASGQRGRFARDAQIPFEEDIAPRDARVVHFHRRKAAAAHPGEHAQ
jgi:cytochrome c oxidase cbb3-type subunit 4